MTKPLHFPDIPSIAKPWSVCSCKSDWIRPWILYLWAPLVTINTKQIFLSFFFLNRICEYLIESNTFGKTLTLATERERF